VHRGVQFATTEDGVRIAHTVSGAGYPLFWLPHFLASNVQLEWEFAQQYVYNWLGQHFTVVRFDCRGLGLSDREVDDISLEARMRDLRAVARKLHLDRFALVGIEGGGNLAAAYAAAYPECVSHLVFVNWTARFRDEQGGGRQRALGVLLDKDWDMLAENIGGVAFGYDHPVAAGYGRLVRASVTQPMARRYGAELIKEDLFPASSRCARNARAALPGKLLLLGRVRARRRRGRPERVHADVRAAWRSTSNARGIDRRVRGAVRGAVAAAGVPPQHPGRQRSPSARSRCSSCW
jgi:pimeloyl-ACP methyl ester carboxylesterase